MSDKARLERFPYPRQLVVGLFDSEQDLQHAVEALERVRFDSDSHEVLEGQEDARSLDLGRAARKPEHQRRGDRPRSNHVMRAEQVTDPVAYHAEGPVWSERWGGLRWVDMFAGDVLSLGRDGTITREHLSEIVAALRPRRDGGAVLGFERGFALQDPDGTVEALRELWSDRNVRMNEGGCDPEGRFYCGSMASDKQAGAGALYRLDPDGAVTVVLEGVTVSNGLDWSTDGSRAYYNDTDTYRTDVFDYDAESGLTARRPFVEVEAEVGGPDGLTVDSEGGVWIAINRGGAVHRYTPAGALDAVVEVPARKVTACAFGGPRLDELFITTSREDLEPGDDPLAGSVFRAEPGVRGQPVREFAG